MPYYIRDPKRDHNFDNHPHASRQARLGEPEVQLSREVAGTGRVFGATLLRLSLKYLGQRCGCSNFPASTLQCLQQTHMPSHIRYQCAGGGPRACSIDIVPCVTCPTRIWSSSVLCVMHPHWLRPSAALGAFRLQGGCGVKLRCEVCSTAWLSSVLIDPKMFRQHVFEFVRVSPTLPPTLSDA